MSWIATGVAAASTTAGIIKGVRQKKLGKEQIGRSQNLRTEAYGVKKPALRPEFRTALDAAKLRTLGGLPGEQTLNDQVDVENATNYGRGQQVASSGGELLQYAASLGAQGNQLKRGIGVQSAQMRDKNFGNYTNTLWSVGDQELQNEGIQRTERNKLLDQSAGLENAATANKYEGGNAIISSLVNSAGQAAGAYSASKNTDKFVAQLASNPNLTDAHKQTIASVAPSLNDSQKSAMLNLSPEQQQMFLDLLASGTSFEDAYAQLLKQNRY